MPLDLVSEGCLRHVGARFLNEKSLGYQWSRLQLEPGIVRDVTTTENIKINQKNFRLTLRGPGRGENCQTHFCQRFGKGGWRAGVGD